MVGQNERRCRLQHCLAVTLLLLSLAPSLTCFSLRRLSKKVNQEKVASDAAVMGIRSGHILFNGKELNSQPGSPFAAATSPSNTGLAHVDSPQSDGPEMMLGQTLQLENTMANEAAWMHLNPMLLCGLTKMKFKVMGPGAAQLQLDIGNSHTLPLIHVPKTCGYSIQQNALGLSLVVPYNGCRVTQKNGYYVLPMSWLKTPVKLTCPMVQSPDAVPAAADATTAQPATTALPTTQPSPPINPPVYPNYQYFPYYPVHPFPWAHHKFRPSLPLAPTAGPATTAQPTTAMPTTQPSPPMNPPVYPNYQYFPYYPVDPFPWAHHKFRPSLPLAPTAGPATTAQPTTAMPTTQPSPPMNPPVYPIYQYFPYYPVDPFPWAHHKFRPTLPRAPTAGPATTAQPATTTAPTPEALLAYPYAQYYQNYLYYPSNMPANVPVTDTLSQASQFEANPTTTSAPGIACSNTKIPSSNGYQSPTIQYVPDNWFPFGLDMWHKNKPGKRLDSWKYKPQAGYQSGFQAQIYPQPGFLNPQPMP